MILYHLHDWQHAVLTPWRLAAEATQAMFQHPYTPASYTQMGRAIAAGAELFERTTRKFNKPIFALPTTKRKGKTIEVTEEIVDQKPFCRLIHFKRTPTNNDDPKFLIVAPMSGHHSTLLRGTVKAMLPEHDVYITDWLDAKTVSLSAGKFDVDDYIAYVIEFIKHLGPGVNVMAVCQPAPLVLAAAAIMADQNDPAQPSSMTLMGGPIDPHAAPTTVTRLAETRPIDWFKSTVIHALPFYYPGAYRLVYPGFLQLQGFISMNVERHFDEHMKLFRNLVRGDGEEADQHRRFYDEYMSVMDITAEFYLQTIERIFKNNDLMHNRFYWRGHLVKPETVKKTALLTIEGELDDISAVGQTTAAHKLCSGLSADMKQSYLQIGVGHYGIFNGRKWRENIQPIVHDFIRKNGKQKLKVVSDKASA